MMEAITGEYLQRKSGFEPPWETVYFGGGTPSVMEPHFIGKLMHLFHENGGLAPNAEVTLEANPEDITDPNMTAWFSAGINRLSIGVQSLNDQTLALMNRKHSSLQSVDAVRKSLDAGFQSVNIDLIFGGFHFSMQEWQNTLDWAFECGANHISAYGLTVEPRTRLQKQIAKGQIPIPMEDEMAEAYEYLFSRAMNEGWDFYEISNLSKPGCRAKHNSNYWQGKPYLGLGPSAHSFNGKNRRCWNVSDNNKYIKQVLEKRLEPEEEILEKNDLYNEWVMTSLRKVEGLNRYDAENLIPGIWDNSLASFAKWQQQGFVLYNENNLALTLKGRLFADAITADLML